MSDSVQPHRRQPTRLPRPWDSPGKNTGVGCHFLLQCMKVKSEGEVAQSCLTLSDPMDCSPPGSPIPGILQARVLEWVAIAFSNTAPLVFPKGFGILVDCPALSRCSVPVCSMNSKGISLSSFHQNLIPPSWSLVHFFPHTFQLLAESCI